MYQYVSKNIKILPFFGSEITAFKIDDRAVIIPARQFTAKCARPYQRGLFDISARPHFLLQLAALSHFRAVNEDRAGCGCQCVSPDLGFITILMIQLVTRLTDHHG